MSCMCEVRKIKKRPCTGYHRTRRIFPRWKCWVRTSLALVCCCTLNLWLRAAPLQCSVSWTETESKSTRLACRLRDRESVWLLWSNPLLCTNTALSEPGQCCDKQTMTRGCSLSVQKLERIWMSSHFSWNIYLFLSSCCGFVAKI